MLSVLFHGCGVCMCLCVFIHRGQRGHHVSRSASLCLVPLRWGLSLKASEPQQSYLCLLHAGTSDIPVAVANFYVGTRYLNPGPHAHAPSTPTCWAIFLVHYYTFKLTLLIDVLWNLFMVLICILQWGVCVFSVNAFHY